MTPSTQSTPYGRSQSGPLTWYDSWPSQDLAHQSLCLAANMDPQHGPLALLEQMEFLHLLRHKAGSEIVRRTQAGIRDRVLTLAPDLAGAYLLVPATFSGDRYGYALGLARVIRDGAESAAPAAPLRGDGPLASLVGAITDVHQPDRNTGDLMIQL